MAALAALNAVGDVIELTPGATYTLTCAGGGASKRVPITDAARHDARRARDHFERRG